MRRQTRREFLKAGGGAIAAGWLGGCACGAPFSHMPRHPNVLLIFTDDQQFDTIGSLGNTHISTPNLDYLVRRGTTFTRAYIMGSMSGAVCIPSRAMLLTGRSLFHLRGVGNVVPEDHVMLPQVLRTAGYATFHTGKWHQDKKSLGRCFTHIDKVFFGGMSDQYAVPVQNHDPAGEYAPRRAYTKQGKHSSELFSDAAIEFLRAQPRDMPFYAEVCYTAPHDPRQAPPEFAAMYKPQDIVLPENFMPEHPFDNGEMKVRDETLAPWPRTPDEIRRHIADYYAAISYLDFQIGRVLEALRQTDRLDGTMIIFAGDNGLALGRHGLMGKQSLYEHSVHVPLVICGPGLPRGHRREAFCYLLDVFPTICKLVGAATPASVEGHSLVAILRDDQHTVRRRLFLAYKDVQRAVRDERFKLIEYNVGGTRTTQLFDLSRDPWEVSNLAAGPQYAGELAHMRAELLNLKAELGDDGSFWRGYKV